MNPSSSPRGSDLETRLAYLLRRSHNVSWRTARRQVAQLLARLGTDSREELARSLHHPMKDPGSRADPEFEREVLAGLARLVPEEREAFALLLGAREGN